MKPDMLYSQKRGSDYWVETFLLGDADGYNYTEYRFRLNGVVYKRPSRRFQTALNKLMMWEKLRG